MAFHVTFPDWHSYHTFCFRRFDNCYLVYLYNVLTRNEHNIISNKLADISWISTVQTLFCTLTIHFFLHPYIPASCQQTLDTISSGFWTSSNGNIFRVTGHSFGKFTGDRWIPRQGHGDLTFSLICARINVWINNREAGDLRHLRAFMTSL